MVDEQEVLWLNEREVLTLVLKLASEALYDTKIATHEGVHPETIWSNRVLHYSCLNGE